MGWSCLVIVGVESGFWRYGDLILNATGFENAVEILTGGGEVALCYGGLLRVPGRAPRERRRIARRCDRPVCRCPWLRLGSKGVIERSDRKE